MRKLLLLACLGLIGCGGEGGSGSSGTPGPKFVGSWSGTNLEVTVAADGSFSGHFQDDPNSTVTGTCVSSMNTVAGTVSGTYQYPSQAVHAFTGSWSTHQAGSSMTWAVKIDGAVDETYSLVKQ